AGGERGARVGRRRAELALQIDRPPARKRGAMRRALAARDPLLRRLAHDSGDGTAQADDLGGLLPRRGAVAQFVHGVEQALDRTTVLPFEHLERQVHGHRVLLAHIAHIGRAPYRDLLRLDRSTGNRGAPLALEVTIDTFDRRERSLVEAYERGAHEIVAQIREQHAEGGEDPGRSRHDDGPDADLARDLDRMQWPGATIGDQREIAGIETALRSDSLHRVR